MKFTIVVFIHRTHLIETTTDTCYKFLSSQTSYVDPRRCARATAAPRYMTHVLLFFNCVFFFLKIIKMTENIRNTLVFLFFFCFFLRCTCAHKYSCAYKCKFKWFVYIVAALSADWIKFLNTIILDIRRRFSHYLNLHTFFPYKNPYN